MINLFHIVNTCSFRNYLNSQLLKPHTNVAASSNEGAKQSKSQKNVMILDYSAKLGIN